MKGRRVLSVSLFMIGALVLLNGCKKIEQPPQASSSNETATNQAETSTPPSSDEKPVGLEKNNNAAAVNKNQAVSPDKQEPAEPRIEVTLFQQNNSGVAGTAVLTESASKVTVVINLLGVPRSSAAPASIRIGSCGVLGDAKHVLNNVVNGASVTVLSASLNEILSYAPLVINISKSNQEIGSSVSCGRIEVN